MNCPACGYNVNEVVRTERSAKTDRRRHECRCGVRWTSVAKLERGSVTQPSITGGQTPPLIQGQTSISGGSTGPVYSEGNLFNPGEEKKIPNSSASLLSGTRARAQSTERAGGPEFYRLLGIFEARWQSSYRRPYPTTGADRSQLGRFMREQPGLIDGFQQMCDRYLRDREAFTIRRSNSHSLRWLVTNGLSTYGGTPRETAEQAAARIRREHEARKAAGRAPPANTMVRDLMASLVNGKTL